MTTLSTTTDKKNRIQITRISDNGVTYLAPEMFTDIMGCSKMNVQRVFHLFEVSAVYIGSRAFYDELMGTIVAESWRDEDSKIKFMRMGVSVEFEKRLKAQKENQ